MLKSDVIKVLGAASFAEFPAIRCPGSVVWCNFDLARELGFNVSPSNRLTPELHEQLITSLSLRAVAPAEINGHRIVTMYADKYGGDGVSPALGAGRAGFLADGNLYVKGLGFTPLFRHNDKDDFVHSHGGVHFEDCLSEAVFGEVNHNLFTLGSTRIVAIIDQGRHVTEPSGRQRHIALAVRVGPQLRPGHLLARRARGSQTPLEMFVQMARATGQIVSNGLPDVSATMLRVIDDHAQAAAESFRWRMIHGALSPSNMDLSGAMLDLPTQSTQPRTAPIFKLDYLNSTFGAEHKDRGYYLAEMYRRLLRATDPSTRERFNAKWVNVSSEMDRAYRKHLDVQLLCAAGLKPRIARQICADHPELARGFAEVLLEMAALKNQGSACVARRVVEDVAVLDIFNLLRWSPRDHFSGRPCYLKRLRPVYKGNRFQIARKKEKVNALARRFASAYRELMTMCAEHRDSIIARAEFENEPIDALYCSTLYEDLNRAIAKYKSTGNGEIIREAIDSRVARSLRSVDGLLAQGSSRRLPDGGLETQIRTIDGIRYSVRAWNNRRQTRKVRQVINRSVIEFEVEPSCLAGRVRAYTFAIPDGDDLLRMS
ncbi:MAG TPA: hypothetical protein VFR51_13940 [Pyrinomonadaceae bacterium]|nr:hypothetical protein [Pyrinomonadaceae bacterium]